ncbi:PQQ-binding-like beta-propeller repeat protein [Blastopirellula marina]|uniref:Serine/threonine protein kinase n=1 Tax=Blastopirellula marina TaxID=124 RepID=A0A2S8G9M6_9BACT|nr:PQQ-binding-like beta-propeller repeat protein [Blastopirellula marina]PQO41166.1 serine/threonine protein kinase [Blastopirellula marina]PTL46042.1 serine/threonine protein kinase [Blastopirellula marina]
MSRLFIVGLFVVFVALASSIRPAIAQSPPRDGDWAEFRGPTGQGHADQSVLPTHWAPDSNITWRTEIPGVGWSSPVIVDGRVYVTTAVPLSEDAKPDQSLRALCLDVNSGEILWNVEVFQENGQTAPRIHPKNSHASPTAIVEEDKVYVHFGHLGTACLNTSDGSLVWATQELMYKPTHGNGGSPVLVGDKLIFSIDGVDKQEVVALDKATGKIAWETERGKKEGVKPFSFCTSLVIEVNGQKQLISPGSGIVLALDPATGDEIWRVDYGKGYSVVPRPVYANGLLYICTGYDRSTMIAVRPDGTGDLTETHVEFTVDKGVPYNPSLLAVEDAVYMISDNGVLSCLDGKTGKLRWKQRIGGNFSASPLYANGLVYLLDEAGLTTVFKPGEQFEEVAQNDLKERSLASFGISGNAILLRTEKALYRIEIK